MSDCLRRHWKKVLCASSGLVFLFSSTTPAMAEIQIFRDTPGRWNLRLGCERLPSMFNQNPMVLLYITMEMEIL